MRSFRRCLPARRSVPPSSVCLQIFPSKAHAGWPKRATPELSTWQASTTCASPISASMRLLRLQPDVILIAGGTDGGASRSVQKMLEPSGISSLLLAQEKQPAVLFAGNQKLDGDVRNLLGGAASALHISPNVRPSLETEDSGPGGATSWPISFSACAGELLKGMDVLDAWSGGHVLPTAYAEGRMLSFLSKVYGGSRGAVLSIDIGASAAVVAAGFKEKTTLRVYPQFGLGESLPGLLQYTSLEEILRWSPLDVSTGAVA